MSDAHSNNLNVSNVDVYQTATDGPLVMRVRFNISWANSWKDATNYDAAWVFIKYSMDSGETWNHGTIYYSYTGYASGTALSVSIPSDKKGAFFHRGVNGTGTVSTMGAYFSWDYTADAVDLNDILSKQFAIKVIGIEMVQIPTGNFYIGDATGGAGYGYCTFGDENNFLPVQISTATSDFTLSVDCSANPLTDTSTYSFTVDGDAPSISSSVGDSNTGFPTGYTAFYLMKYEITEGLWVTFFNTLTPAQKANRDITSASGKNTDATVYRNTVSWDGSGDATTTRPDRAMHYLSWMDLCAIADWAALRPMTQLEYEKAARGPTSSLEQEYAWGSTSATAAATISGSSENGTETISTASANVNSTRWNTAFAGGDTGKGPLRSGIFATGSSTRTTSGSGYYGNMELTGNVHEYVVSVGNPQGRAFDGSPGDGVLTTTTGYEGNATNTDWPGIDSTSARGVTGYLGSGKVGGGDPTTNISPVSVHDLCPSNTSARAVGGGGRLARTS